MTSAPWLPPGVIERGVQLGAAVDRILPGSPVGDAEAWVRLPERVVESPTRPAPPLKWHRDALCVDLGPDDEGTWATFSAVAADDPDIESIARRAQVWRLAVSPYRSTTGPPTGWCSHKEIAQMDAATEEVDVRTRRVVDLSAMWAGPLATELLGRAGADVLKIESSVRPDGLRFGDNDDNTSVAPMFAELNRSKEFIDLDLRRCDDRTELDRLLTGADLLVTSLSPRAVANFELDPAHLAERHPDLCSVHITAYPAGAPESEWVGYGTGVHAASGLAMLTGTPQTPAFSYPDPLAGFAACLLALQALAGDAPRHQRTSLAEATAELWRCVS